MSGVKGKSGRKPKSLSRADAMRSLTKKLPKAIEVIGDTMEGVNAERLCYEAAISIKDSVMGKPKIDMGLNIEGGEQLGVGLVVELFKLLAQRRRELEGGNYALIEGKEQGENETNQVAQDHIETP